MKDRILKEILAIEQELDSKYKNYPNVSLLSGMGGMPIFYYLLFQLTKDDTYRKKSDECIELIFESINDTELNVSYCTGLAGIGYMLNFLGKHDFLEEDINEELMVIDDAIANYSLANIKSMPDTDFLHGGLGSAFYLHERLPYNQHVLAKTIKIFEQIATITRKDIRKAKKVQKLKKAKDNAHLTNCGFAHGLASNIIILSKFLVTFPNHTLVKKTLTEAVNHLLSFASDNHTNLSIFPGIAVNTHLADYKMALSWCYGDQSVAYSLYKASTVLKDKELEHISKEFMFRTLKRDTLEDAVNTVEICDSSLCHGISSIAYLHKKLFQVTKDKHFDQLYKNFAHELLQKGQTANRYQSYYKLEGFKEDYSFLNGLIGVGVFFIDYLLDNDSSSWDGIFLLD